MTAAEPEVDGRAMARASMVKELRERGMEPVRRKPPAPREPDFDVAVLKTARR